MWTIDDHRMNQSFLVESTIEIEDNKSNVLLWLFFISFSHSMDIAIPELKGIHWKMTPILKFTYTCDASHKVDRYWSNDTSNTKEILVAQRTKCIESQLIYFSEEIEQDLCSNMIHLGLCILTLTYFEWNERERQEERERKRNCIKEFAHSLFFSISFIQSYSLRQNLIWYIALHNGGREICRQFFFLFIPHFFHSVSIFLHSACFRYYLFALEFAYLSLSWRICYACVVVSVFEWVTLRWRQLNTIGPRLLTLNNGLWCAPSPDYKYPYNKYTNDWITHRLFVRYLSFLLILFLHTMQYYGIKLTMAT